MSGSLVWTNEAELPLRGSEGRRALSLLDQSNPSIGTMSVGWGWTRCCRHALCVVAGIPSLCLSPFSNRPNGRKPLPKAAPLVWSYGTGLGCAWPESFIEDEAQPPLYLRHEGPPGAVQLKRVSVWSSDSSELYVVFIKNPLNSNAVSGTQARHDNYKKADTVFLRAAHLFFRRKTRGSHITTAYSFDFLNLLEVRLIQ